MFGDVQLVGANYGGWGLTVPATQTDKDRLPVLLVVKRSI